MVILLARAPILLVPPHSQLFFIVDEKLLFHEYIPSEIWLSTSDYLKAKDARFTDYSNYVEYHVIEFLRNSNYISVYKDGLLNSSALSDSIIPDALIDRLSSDSERDTLFRTSIHVWRDYLHYVESKTQLYLPDVNISLAGSINSASYARNKKMTEESLNQFYRGAYPANYNIWSVYHHLFEKVLLAKSLHSRVTGLTGRKVLIYFTYEYFPVLAMIFKNNPDFIKNNIFMPSPTWHKTLSVSTLLNRIANSLDMPRRYVHPFVNVADRLLTHRCYMHLHSMQFKDDDLRDLINIVKRNIKIYSISEKIFQIVIGEIFDGIMTVVDTMGLMENAKSRAVNIGHKTVRKGIDKICQYMEARPSSRGIAGRLFILYLLRYNYFPMELNFSNYESNALAEGTKGKYVSVKWWEW